MLLTINTGIVLFYEIHLQETTIIALDFLVANNAGTFFALTRILRLPKTVKKPLLNCFAILYISSNDRISTVKQTKPSGKRNK